MNHQRTNSRRQPFWLLLGLGFLGILSLIPLIRRQVPAAPQETLPFAPAFVTLLALLQSTVLTTIAVATGLVLAPRVGLRSLLVEVSRGERRELPLAAVASVLLPALTLLLETLFRPWTGEVLEELEREQPRTLLTTVQGIFYGGITEELLLRWGLLSLLAWVGGKLTSSLRPVKAGVMWAVIVASSILFGVGHLPALAAFGSLTVALVLCTVVLNAFAGIVFGWLYWQRTLETAMMAHAGTHGVLSLLLWAGNLL